MANDNRKYFGTDGIRGKADGPLMASDFVEHLGAAAGVFLRNGRPGASNADGGPPPVALIGRDTRESGGRIQDALARGLRGRGVAVVDGGVAPTPATAYLVREKRLALGVMITASHNPASDNGIKFFDTNGHKLPDSAELEIERLLDGQPSDVGGLASWNNGELINGAEPANPGTGGNLTDSYVDYICKVFDGLSLDGVKVVVDTAHGATCGTTPVALRRLGATVASIGDAPDGKNINQQVGSEYPDTLVASCRAAGAHLGLAHDGDGDRVVICDESGAVLSGEEFLAILALDALEQGQLAHDMLVTTIMSNQGLDAAIKDAGGQVVRTAVGDRYVLQEMLQHGYNLGGESSGHYILGDILETGDGLVAALALLRIMRRKGKPLSELRRVMRLYPQETRNLMVAEKVPLDETQCLKAAIRKWADALKGEGRILVRYSGTESKLRLLAECKDASVVKKVLQELTEAAASDLQLL